MIPTDKEREEMSEKSKSWRQKELEKLKMTVKICNLNKENCLEKLILTKNKLEELEKQYEFLMKSEQSAQNKLRDFTSNRDFNVKDFE